MVRLRPFGEGGGPPLSCPLGNFFRVEGPPAAQTRRIEPGGVELGITAVVLLARQLGDSASGADPGKPAASPSEGCPAAPALGRRLGTGGDRTAPGRRPPGHRPARPVEGSGRSDCRHRPDVGRNRLRARVMVFVDSNISMYVAGRDHPHRAPAQRLLERARAGDITICSSTEVLQEIFYRYAALERRDLAGTVYDLFVQLCPVILPVALADTDRARRLMTDRRQPQHPRCRARRRDAQQRRDDDRHVRPRIRSRG